MSQESLASVARGCTAGGGPLASGKLWAGLCAHVVTYYSCYTWECMTVGAQLLSGGRTWIS